MSDNVQQGNGLSDQEQDVIRRGAFGALSLVSQADPGFFAMFKESMAGSRALSEAPENVRSLLQGGMVLPERASSREQMQQNVYDDLSEAMQVLQRDPAAQTGFRNVVLAACQQVAEASKGVTPEEQQVIDRVRQTVSGGGAQGVFGGTQDPAGRPKDFAGTPQGGYDSTGQSQTWQQQPGTSAASATGSRGAAEAQAPTPGNQAPAVGETVTDPVNPGYVQDSRAMGNPGPAEVPGNEPDRSSQADADRPRDPGSYDNRA